MDQRIEEIKKKPLNQITYGDIDYLLQIRAAEDHKREWSSENYNCILIHENGYKQPFKITTVDNELPSEIFFRRHGALNIILSSQAFNREHCFPQESVIVKFVNTGSIDEYSGLMMYKDKG